MIWIFFVIALFLVTGLTLYAIRLLKQLKVQKELIAKAKNNRVIRLKESIDIIARAMQSGECNLSEGVIRLTMLLMPFGKNLSTYPAMANLYEVVRDMPTHDDRKLLEKRERMRLDLERESAEVQFEKDIKQELYILLEDIKFLSELDIGNIIIGNLEVYFLIKEYFEKVKCTASSLFAIKSTESADFFYNLGFDRLVFPRNIEMKDIIEISKNFSKKIELEAFIYGGGCNYCEGTCHLPHIFLGDISFLNEDIKKKSPLPICKFPIKALNHTSLEMLHQGNKMCGLCYCKYFDSLGIKYFKITGRTLNSLKKIEILKKLNNIIEESSFYKCDLDSSYCLYGKRRVE